MPQFLDYSIDFYVPPDIYIPRSGQTPVKALLEIVLVYPFTQGSVTEVDEIRQDNSQISIDEPSGDKRGAGPWSA